MIVSLYIRNYALIEELSVEFQKGLNIITGETGAGKSIIIDALGLILGERADTGAVRKGADKALVEAQFNVAKNGMLKKLLEGNDIEYNENLILRRELSSKGQSRCFINDTPSTIALLKQVGDLLVDLHGQHEHQSLLRTETHIAMLDNFGGLEHLVKEFREVYQRTLGLLKDIGEFKSKKEQILERRNLYEFQIKEIDEIGPTPGEEEQLETELTILEHSEKLSSATQHLYESLYENDDAIHDRLVGVRNHLEELATIDTSFEESKNEAASAIAIISELAKYIQTYRSKIESDPPRLEEIRERLGRLTLLKKKYGGSLDAVISHREKIGREVSLAENFDAEIATLEKTFKERQAACSELAQQLSSKRRETAKKVNFAVAEALSGLGINNPKFETVIENRKTQNSEIAIVKVGKDYVETFPNGIDLVEFYISTTAGESTRPLVKVASGGEISRVMLALKTILAKNDRLPLLIFDEIDVGVSGRIAQAVGLSLKNLSQNHQVITITHLPQIAGLGNIHFVVEKIEDGKKSFTRMRKLSLEDRIVEVAKLMSGEEVTDAGIEGAKELMGLQ